MGDEEPDVAASQSQSSTKRPLESSPTSQSSQTTQKKTRGDEFFSSGSIIIEDDSNMNELLRQFKIMSSSMATFRNSVIREIKAIGTRVGNIEAKILVMAPPTNLEGDLQLIKDEISKLADKVTSTTKSPASNEDTENSPMEETSSPAGSSADNQVTWKNQLNKRKLAYYKYLKNTEHHAIYVGWQNQEPRFIPVRFLPTFINNEPLAEYEARRKQSEAELACFMEILSVRAASAKEELEKIDSEVLQRIHDAEISEAEKNNLIKKWQDEVKIEEGKSTELWSPKKEGIMGTVDRQTNNNKVIIVDQKLYSAVTSNGPKNNTGRLDPQEKRTFADVASNNSSSGESSTNNQDEGNWTPVFNNKRNRSRQNHQPPERTQQRQVTPGTRSQRRVTSDLQVSFKPQQHSGLNNNSGRGTSGFQPRRPPYRRKP